MATDRHCQPLHGCPGNRVTRAVSKDKVPGAARREAVESLASRLYDDVTVTEVIRPAAVLSERNARRVLDGLRAEDVRSGGRWHAEPGCWRLFERPWKGKDERSAAARAYVERTASPPP